MKVGLRSGAIEPLWRGGKGFEGGFEGVEGKECVIEVARGSDYVQVTLKIARAVRKVDFKGI